MWWRESGHSIPLLRGPGKLYSPVSITAGSESGRPVVSGPHLSSFSTWSIKICFLPIVIRWDVEFVGDSKCELGMPF